MARNIGRYSNQKGKRFENKIAQAFKPFFPHVQRHLEFQEKNAHRGHDLENMEPFFPQLKAYAKYVSLNKIEQVRVKHGIPLLVTRADHRPSVLALYERDFIRVLAHTDKKVLSETLHIASEADCIHVHDIPGNKQYKPILSLLELPKHKGLTFMKTDCKGKRAIVVTYLSNFLKLLEHTDLYALRIRYGYLNQNEIAKLVQDQLGLEKTLEMLG